MRSLQSSLDKSSRILCVCVLCEALKTAPFPPLALLSLVAEVVIAKLSSSWQGLPLSLALHRLTGAEIGRRVL